MKQYFVAFLKGSSLELGFSNQLQWVTTKMQGNSPIVNLIRQHAFVIFWGVLVLYAGSKLSIIGVVNRQPISPVPAFVSEFASMSFWLFVAPAVVKLLKKFPIADFRHLWVYIPAVFCISVLSLCWTSVSDLITIPGTPSFGTQMALKLLYQLGWAILLCLLFFGILFWSRVGSITFILPSDKEGQKAEVKFKVNFNNRTFYVNASSIRSIESKDYYAELNTGDNRYLIREPIYRLSENLSELGFEQISRSAIANLFYVKALVKQKGKSKVELDDGTLIKVSRTYLSRLQEALANRDSAS